MEELHVNMDIKQKTVSNTYLDRLVHGWKSSVSPGLVINSCIAMNNMFFADDEVIIQGSEYSNELYTD